MTLSQQRTRSMMCNCSLLTFTPRSLVAPRAVFGADDVRFSDQLAEGTSVRCHVTKFYYSACVENQVCAWHQWRLRALDSCRKIHRYISLIKKTQKHMQVRMFRAEGWTSVSAENHDWYSGRNTMPTLTHRCSAIPPVCSAVSLTDADQQVPTRVQVNTLR